MRISAERARLGSLVEAAASAARADSQERFIAAVSAETMAAVLTGANPRGKHLFIDSLPTKENELKNAIEYFGGRFVKLGELADIRGEHGEKIKVGSHGFGRHSFVLMCLNSDIPVHDIGTLIGDSAHVVEQHYSEWISARAARLESRMMKVIEANPIKW